jgi:formate hydrogenlyase transcriptional activator
MLSMNSGTRKADSERFIDMVPALAWCVLPDGSPESLNQQYLHWSLRGGVAGIGMGSSCSPRRPGAAQKPVPGFLQSGEAGEIEARLRRFDGEYRWFLIRAVPVHDEDGNVLRWYGINSDIDDRKCAEDRVRQDETDLRKITDAIPQSIAVLAPDGTALYANRVALDETGLTLEEVRAHGFFSGAFHPDDVDRVRAERRAGLSRGVAFELEMRTLQKCGQYRWRLIQYNPLRDEQGRIIRWYATGTDIQNQKKAEERLRNENLVLREELDRSSMFEEIVGSSEPMRQVLRQVAKVAPSDSTVLILGETGTGKELIARALYRRSSRSTRAFVRVNGATIPQSLIASEFFGTRKAPSRGHCRDVWGGLNPLTAERFSLMKLAIFPSRLKLRSCTCSRSENSSGWGAIIRFQWTCG